jgi:hypothetical protein
MYSELLAAGCLLFFGLTLPGPGGGPSTSPFGEPGDNDPAFDGPSPGSLPATMCSVGLSFIAQIRGRVSRNLPLRIKGECRLWPRNEGFGAVWLNKPVRNLTP